MKRVYVLTTALLLLAIIAGVIYMNKDQAVNAADKNSTQVQTNTPTPALITDDNILNDLAGPVNEDNNPTWHSFTNNRQTADKSVNLNLAVAAESGNPDDAGIKYIGQNTSRHTKGIGYENTNEYLGYKPENVEGGKEHKFLRIRMPENLGFEVGYSQSSLTDNQTNNIPVGSVVAGLLYNVDLGNHFAIQPGVTYLTKGNRLQNEEDINTREKLTLHYVEVPVNFVAKFGKPGNTRFMIGAGPYVSYLAGIKHRYETPGLGEGADANPLPPQYTTSNINRMDWGLGGFVGVQSPDGFFLKAGAQYGMMDINKNAGGSTSDRNTSFMVAAGFIMGGK